MRVHNLQNIDLDLLLHKLIVITGVSGSGKSSLAFDTLYAEGQRRYIESFSTYARQFLDRLEKPDADRIGQMPPAIAISQKTAGHSRRSTVATVTEIHDYLRLAFAKIGVVVCPSCHCAVRSDSPASVLRQLQAFAEGTRYQVCFPFELEAEQSASTLRENGFTRVISGNKTINLSEPATDLGRDVLVVVDRLAAGTATPERIADSVELAFSRGHGQCVVLELVPAAEQASVSTESAAESATEQRPVSTTIVVDGRSCRLLRFNSRLVCSDCGQEFIPPEPRLFSFNSPLGACPRCHGFGSIRADSPPAAGRRSTFEPCPECHGRRLQPLSLAVQVGGIDIAEFCAQTVEQSQGFLKQLQVTLLPQEQSLLKSILPQIESRLGYLQSAGLNYLTLDRPMNSLSSGEAQRVSLTGALGSSLVNTLYVLDEPTAGLHPRDTERLLLAVERLRDSRNTVVVVEHDPLFMRRADQLVDIGPGAGRDGGRVVYQGPPGPIETCSESVTGAFLAGRRGVVAAVLNTRRTPQPQWLRLEGARHNNLKNITVQFPLGVLCAVTGVSGSGKSSLIEDTLYPALCRKRGWRIVGVKEREGASHASAAPECDGLVGDEQIDEVILVDRSPIGRTPRSNPATYLKIFGEIRGLFAQAAEAKVRDYKAVQFSLNAASGGRCPTCQGNGSIAIDMQFLPDVTMVCPDCHGTRFRQEVLEVKYRGLNIAEVLALTVREAFPFFRGQSKLQRRLKLLKDVGLGYIALGQPANTLSGGESQRLKLASCMSGGKRVRTLFLLDEPTTGLHPADVERLIDCFNVLLSAGHSLIVIEHNLDVIRSADHIIDLGPEAGAGGGRVVAQGTPEEVARVAESVTARYLR